MMLLTLSIASPAPIKAKEGTKLMLDSFSILSRGDWIRTSDPTPPRRIL